MHLHHDSDTIAEAHSASLPQAHLHAGAELDNAREADAAWRSERSDRFRARSVRVRRRVDWLETALAIFALVSGAGLVLTVVAWPSWPGGEERFAAIGMQMSVAALCVLGFVGFSIAACGVRQFADWQDRRSRERAGRDGIEFND